MPLVPDSETLETDRLILRRAHVEDAAVYRELWTERDPRVPPHRQIDSDGRPTVEDIAARISADAADPRSRLLTVVRKDTADVIGYCESAAWNPIVHGYSLPIKDLSTAG